MKFFISKLKEVKTKEDRITEHDIHIHEIKTGRAPRQPVSVRYQDEDGNQYVSMAGGLAWPGADPGHVVVVGVKKNKDSNQYITLAEAEHRNISTLIEMAYYLYREWGWNCLSIPWRWYGAPDPQYLPFITRFNKGLKSKEDKKRPFSLSPTVHYEDPDRDGWQILCRTMYAMARTEGVLKTGATPLLRARLQAMTEQDVAKRKAVDNPAIAAFAYVVASLYEREPWFTLYSGKPARLFPTADEAEKEALYHSEQAIKYLRYQSGDEIDAEPMEGYTRGLLETVV